MIFCPNCGAQLPEGSRFCLSCGVPLQTAPPAQVREAPQQTPAPQYTDMPQYGYPQAPGYGYGAPVPEKPKKKRRVWTFLGLGALLAAVAAVLILLLGGGGKALGVYDCAACAISWMEVQSDGEWIELKAGGNARLFVFGVETAAKWELAGTELTVTHMGETYTGTLEDGVIRLDIQGITYVFEKDGAAAAEPQAGTGQSKAGPSNSVLYLLRSLFGG